MLNKRVCKNCIGEDWDKYDEDTWEKNHRIYCPVLVRLGKSSSIDLDKIPKECPYKLEHTVIGDENEV